MRANGAVRMTMMLPVALLAAAGAPSAATVAETFRAVKDAVVVVRTTEQALPATRGATPASIQGTGSGVLIDAEGRILTAAHVVQTAARIAVEFVNGDAVPARVLGSEPSADVALLQLERLPAGLAPARLGDSDAVAVGDEVLVIGAPLGLGYTLTVGHVSARHASQSTMGGVGTTELLQTDAAIHPGNSGGPMFNLAGEVVGIVSHILSKSGGSEGLGFVVTSNLARRLLLDREPIWSGLTGYIVDGELAAALNLPQPAGVLVQRVAPDSPAARIGLQAGTLPARIGDETVILGGDIILEVGGIKTSEPDVEARVGVLLRDLRPGTPVKITVLRAGRRVDLTLTRSGPGGPDAARPGAKPR